MCICIQYFSLNMMWCRFEIHPQIRQDPAATGINPLHAKFFRRNINIYLHFMSLLHIDMTEIVEIVPQVRQELTYST